MTRAILRCGFAVFVAATLFEVRPAWSVDAAGPAAQQTDTAEDELRKAEARAEDLIDVRNELKRSADFLAEQRHFAVQAQIGFDVMQANGQKVEFGGTRDITVRRPDRARVVSTTRDGSRTTMIFDGRAIWFDLADQNAFVAVQKPGTLDEALAYLVDDLGTPAPLSDLMSTNFFAEIDERIASGFVVGEARIADVDSIHVAFSTDNVDVQMWIERGERPLPVRLVITYRNADGSPQFWAQFPTWNLAPETPDSLFAYTPPEGAELLPITVAVDTAKNAMEGQ